MLPFKMLARLACRQNETLKHRIVSACVLQMRAQSTARASAESFLSGTSSNYLEDLYDRWLEDPKSVDPSFDDYFRKVTEGVKLGEAHHSRPASALALSPRSKPAVAASGSSQSEIDRRIDEHLCVYAVIRAHQTRGNFLANLDPLGIQQNEKRKLPGMTIEEYGMGTGDLDKSFILPRSSFIGGEQRVLQLRDIVGRLRKVYAGSIGVQYTYINNYDQLMWLRKRIESPDAYTLSVDEKKQLLDRMVRSTRFEEYLGRKWSSEKRFGLDGCEVLIPCMKTVLDAASALGTESYIIGMPHRGRLNVLANVCRQPLEKIFCQFDSKLSPSDEGSGDVKYHLGMCHERVNRATSKKIRLAVVANPSHLEAVDPVVQGRTYAEQFYRGDKSGKKVMSIMLHGDAAFAGQGVVFETFHLSELPAYSTKGTIHIIVNNQVGFTTDPRVARSSPFCTDVAKVCNAPIFHVNADDPEAVVEVSKMAAEWRFAWGKDVVIDLVCYRRYGHNETDEPSFTQPLMYKIIRQMPKALEKYAKKLQDEGVVSKEWYESRVATYDKVCEDAYGRAKKETAIRNRDWLDSPWEKFFDGREELAVPTTGISEEHLVHIAQRFSEEPPEIHLHSGLKRTLAARRDLLKARMADWAMGEAFAFGSLLREGVHVRLSGQDVERGTFSHRHHMLHDQVVDRKTYCSLQNMWPSQAQYTVCNSSLSEYGVLGFELGYSLTNPNALICWEAQFGDFANTAQCIIDQFIASGQVKWVRQSGITLLLPHGMEGMGPEHSSARLERFLQLSNDDPDVLPPELELQHTFDALQLREANWFVCNCTTPANLFHVLRRQIALPYRKPLVIMTPKSLLRLPEARSAFEQFIGDTKFQPVLPDIGPAAQHAQTVQKVLFCSGRVYYDLMKERERLGLNEEVAVVRVEQLFPFPYRKLAQVLAQFPTARLCWVQEEHKNAGAWAFVQPRFATLLDRVDPKKRPIKYCGRAPSASTATGNKHMHLVETSKLLSDALGDVTNVIF